MQTRLISLSIVVMLATATLLADANQVREKRLQGRLVASCCWSEPISIHRSEAAAEMRAKLHSLIESGRSDREILKDFTAQYGQRVLIEPEGALGVTAYALPIVSTVLGLSAVILILRRWVRPPETA
jgi:cytochrome c-type biogenesis protein CcmH/NrfF